MKLNVFFLTITLLAFTAGPLAGQDNRPPEPLSSKQVVVNGRPLTGRILEMDGKHFVAVEDLAQTLGGAVAYNGEQIALTLPSASTGTQASTTSSTSQPGRVKGTLTYFFNSNFGNRPDTGSEVWLVKDHIEIAPNESFLGDSEGIKILGASKTYKVFKYTVADGSGNFELSDIAPGLYTLVMKSKHAKGPFGAVAVTQRDLFGRVSLQDVQVKPGETMDASLDFGTTSY